MKGFPNQVAELRTLAKAIVVMADLIQEGKDPRDDGVYGEALIRRGVLGTGHTPRPVEEYLRQQKAKSRKSDQSFRTRARGLRELFRVLDLIEDGGGSVALTATGQQVSNASLGVPADDNGREIWRSAILRMSHDGGDGESSHPYQVLLRLVARRPGITRAKCALALEAKNDSEDELDRITALADLPESRILEEIAVTKPNWDNAKKILPRFAEQLGDVRKVGQAFYLSDAPGGGEARVTDVPVPQRQPTRRPRSSSAVKATTIAKSGTTDGWDEAVDVETDSLDAEALKKQKEKLRDRLHRHNVIVQKVAAVLERERAELYENPFDCLACFDADGILLEVKSLDGTEADEVARVRDALAQLLYYEAFVTKPLLEDRAVRKVACFENEISQAHIEWLEKKDIQVIWMDGDQIEASPHSRSLLANHFGF